MKSKKVISLALAGAMTFGSFYPVFEMSTVKAETASEVDRSWYSEDKTEFTLTNEAQLRGLAEIVNDTDISFRGKTIKLGNDITIGPELWTPIGTIVPPKDYVAFNGTFDGNGHSITFKNTKMAKRTGNVGMGLFGSLIIAKIKNLTLKGTIYADIKKLDKEYLNIGYYGPLAGFSNESTITNCISEVDSKVIMEANINSSANIGNLMGWARGSQVEGCANKGNLEVNTNVTNGREAVHVGALTGYEDGNVRDSYYKSCYNNGNVSLMSNGTPKWEYLHVSGFISSLATTASFVMQNCYSSGNVRSNKENTAIGGIAAKCSTKGFDSNCYYLNGTENGIGTKIEDSVMKSEDFVGMLNGGKDIYVKGSDYPVFKWEAEENKNIDHISIGSNPVKTE